ncbi:Transcriptional regulator, LysR family [Marinobacterium lacunae]|uniref:Transcriptional regulator, LysR family n=1 Tax=Marinobacterium lacunae TaxID=1232683 RepID=A0A081G197_9GAMM|nr:LysR substrate-binding domain-containing protein [Marinobacterium lacunae]KEA64552.1 Transcriptional regulator, LysR family [Marinobacterium lacunae]MBR9885970.1 LysR family transcriptional regulator [Oceanospirillales bacterium]
MPASLPPLNALRTFEVAARHLSFSKAAQELCVTQGAVSKQVQLLEQYLELPLFDRLHSGLVLTDAGRQYLPAISQALETIQSATASLQQSMHASDTLTLNLTPSFSNLWLIPRLDQLRRDMPELKLAMVTGDGAFQFQGAQADMAIRCLPLSLSHEHSTLLKEEVLLPVVNPDLLRQRPIDSPEDLLAHPLIRHITRPQLWRQFLQRMVGGEPTAPRYSHGFEHFYMSLEAARCAQGVALVPDFMASQALARGELVNPLGLAYRSGYGFYFLVPPYRARSVGVQRFHAWLALQLA